MAWHGRALTIDAGSTLQGTGKTTSSLQGALPPPAPCLHHCTLTTITALWRASPDNEHHVPARPETPRTPFPMPHSPGASTPAASEPGDPVSIASSTLPLAQIPSATPVPHLRRYADAVVSWFRGPDPPVDVAFRPLFPRIQTWPTRAFQCHLKRRRAQLAALVAFLLLWLVLFIVVVHYSRFADLVEGVVPMHLGCGASLWYVPCPVMGERGRLTCAHNQG